MYFKAWPFGIVPEKYASVWADRNDLFLELTEIFENFARNKRSYVQHVWGDYGAGKSHALLHFKFLLDKEEKFWFVYSRFPTRTRNFLELYSNGFMSSLNFMAFANKCSTLWTTLTTNMEEEEAFSYILEEIAAQSYDFAQVVYNLGKLLSVQPHQAFRQPSFLLSRMWLQGEKLGKRDRNFIGVMKNIQNDQDAVQALSGIINVFTSEKSTKNKPPRAGLVWILDDCHVLFASPSKHQQLVQHGLRDSIDAVPARMLIIISWATTDVQKIQQGLINDLKTVSGHSIMMVPVLSKENACVFIENLINSEEFKRDDISDSFYPYTQRGIKRAINLISNKGIDLLPRNVIKCFDHLTNEAQKEIWPKRMDIDFVNQFFNQKCTIVTCPLLEE